MCGIFGQVSNDGINEDNFMERLKLMSHRGPDDIGVFHNQGVSLGHVRLSIQDTSIDGHQPMVDKNGNNIIVYNGEIYNFKEIKKSLEVKGYAFNSNSDTEVILNGFIEYGEKIVNKLNGMFAFAIYNKRNGSIFLARDRSGIKPLYFYKKDKDFIFSSEVKVLREFSKGVDFQSKILFLLLGSVPEPKTIYDEISVFPSGCYGYYSNGILETIKYDEYTYSPKIVKPYSEIVKDVNELMHESVKRHLISDAPIGAFLSGGLDSSAITAIAAQYKDNLQTLSLVFEEKDLSEEYYQDLVVKRYSTKHTKFNVNEDMFLESIDSFMDSFDQPSIDGLNTYFVAKAASESGLKAVLSGVGGDEIFYGYPSFKNSKKLHFLSKVPYYIIKIFQQHHKYKKLELLKIESDLALYLPTRSVFSPTEIASILGIKVDVIYKEISNLWEEYNSLHIKKIDDKISFFELEIYMKNQLLRDTDVFGMANSLEIRVPFLDKELVDYVLKIQPQEKYDKHINKIILADAMRSILPDEIIDRPKMGFTLPFEYWFRKHINKFELSQSVKESFLNKQLHWSRVWALIVLSKFSP
jgi:asparagine synthase (glutamine-hydrolysing)